jgi:hypothetical protein
MKKLFIISFLALVVGFSANAQEFKKFRLATGLGYAKPSGAGAGGGLLWDLEPGYRVNDALAVSLRIEGAIVVRGLSEDVDSYNASAAAIGSYTVNGIYYLSNNSFRPYVGAGLGIYSLAAVTVSAGGGGAAAESKIGFYPRIGFDLGHFNINIDYNIVGKSEAAGFDNNGNPKNFDVKNSYLGVRIGGFFFGGRK